MSKYWGSGVQYEALLLRNFAGLRRDAGATRRTGASLDHGPLGGRTVASPPGISVHVRDPRSGWFSSLPLLAAFISLALGGLVLFGWAFQIEAITRLIPGITAVKTPARGRTGTRLPSKRRATGSRAPVSRTVISMLVPHRASG